MTTDILLPAATPRCLVITTIGIFRWLFPANRRPLNASWTWWHQYQTIRKSGMPAVSA